MVMVRLIKSIFLPLLVCGCLVVAMLHTWNKLQNAKQENAYQNQDLLELSCAELMQKNGLFGRKVEVSQAQAWPIGGSSTEGEGGQIHWLMPIDDQGEKLLEFPIFIVGQDFQNADGSVQVSDKNRFAGTLRSTFTLSKEQLKVIKKLFPEHVIRRGYVLEPADTGFKLPLLTELHGLMLAFACCLIGALYWLYERFNSIQCGSVSENANRLTVGAKAKHYQKKLVGSEPSTVMCESNSMVRKLARRYLIQTMFASTGLILWAIVLTLGLLKNKIGIPHWQEIGLGLATISLLISWLVYFWHLWSNNRTKAKGLMRIPIQTDQIPRDITIQFAPAITALARQGFCHEGDFLNFPDRLSITREFLSPDRKTITRLFWHDDRISQVFYSILDTGEIVATFVGNIGINPSDPRLHFNKGVPGRFEANWESHQRFVQSKIFGVFEFSPRRLNVHWRYTLAIEKQLLGQKTDEVEPTPSLTEIRLASASG